MAASCSCPGLKRAALPVESAPRTQERDERGQLSLPVSSGLSVQFPESLHDVSVTRRAVAHVTSLASAPAQGARTHSQGPALICTLVCSDGKVIPRAGPGQGQARTGTPSAVPDVEPAREKCLFNKISYPQTLDIFAFSVSGFSKV